jgi:hypothetical protein
MDVWELGLGKVIAVDFTQQNAQLERRLSDQYERKNWFLSLLSWVDFADVLTLKRSAFIMLMDMITNRPTEFSVFASFYLSAYKRQGWRIEMTQRQQEADSLAVEAVGLGIRPTKYISQRLAIGERAAQRLLKRASEAKMFVFDEKTYTTIEDSLQRMPTERALQRRMAAYRHRCPGYGAHEACEQWTRGDKDLCHPCALHFGHLGERPDWLDYLVRDNRKLARQQAYDDLIGVVAYVEHDPPDELEIAA